MSVSHLWLPSAAVCACSPPQIPMASKASQVKKCASIVSIYLTATATTITFKVISPLSPPLSLPLLRRSRSERRRGSRTKLNLNNNSASYLSSCTGTCCTVVYNCSCMSASASALPLPLRVYMCTRLSARPLASGAATLRHLSHLGHGQRSLKASRSNSRACCSFEFLVNSQVGNSIATLFKLFSLPICSHAACCC